MAQLIILRGNSGSGKTSTAQLLQERLGEGTILISQDMVRRQMLRVNDKVGSVSTDLLETLVDFGMQNCRYVILEGILTKRKHGKMLNEIVDRYSPDVLVYYFDISFEETLKRHQHKNVDFGEDEMEKWYLEKDFLEVEGERIITDEMTQEDIIKEMVNSKDNTK
ncbi:kinase [Macrococcus brunensis]|uniref:kinase n=1 Tax=Macrococcus brunensis TaxID=198483 RepID=UPI001EF15832|nr:kinase [Macrococcus brunensis]ULG74563.1 kinase [Macrococcus brunensis]